MMATTTSISSTFSKLVVTSLSNKVTMSSSSSSSLSSNSSFSSILSTTSSITSCSMSLSCSESSRSRTTEGSESINSSFSTSFCSSFSDDDSSTSGSSTSSSSSSSASTSLFSGNALPTVITISDIESKPKKKKVDKVPKQEGIEVEPNFEKQHDDAAATTAATTALTIAHAGVAVAVDSSAQAAEVSLDVPREINKPNKESRNLFKRQKVFARAVATVSRKKNIYQKHVEFYQTKSLLNLLNSQPHMRQHCPEYPVTKLPMSHCPNCYCFVCDCPASQCTEWKTHCRAKESGFGGTFWKILRNKKLRRHFNGQQQGSDIVSIAVTTEPGSSSTQSEEESQTCGQNSLCNQQQSRRHFDQQSRKWNVWKGKKTPISTTHYCESASVCET